MQWTWKCRWIDICLWCCTKMFQCNTFYRHRYISTIVFRLYLISKTCYYPLYIITATKYILKLFTSFEGCASQFTTVICSEYAHMWQMKGQLLDGWYVETCMKIRYGCLHRNELFSGVYFCRFIWWRFLFTHGTNILVFQWKSTMNSTTSDDVINLKPI